MVLSSFYCQLEAGVKEKGLTIDEAVKIAKENGIDALDIDARIGEGGEEFLKEVLALAEKYDMFISSVYGPYECLVNTEEEYKKSVETMKKCIDFTKKAKSKYFMAVPFRPEDSPESEDELYRKGYRRLMAEIAKYGKEVGVQVTVEDFSMLHQPYSSFEDLDGLLENIPDLKFTYDSGNFMLTGHDELEAVKRYAGYTVHTHIKDYIKSDEPTRTLRNGQYYLSVPVGEGFLRNEAALKYLMEKGYDNSVVIEVNYPDMFDKTMNSVKFFKRVLNL